MDQYQGKTSNFVVKEDTSLGEGRVEMCEYPCGDCEETMAEESAEQKVGDHSEMNS